MKAIAPDEQVTGFARLARRIADWTTKMLFTALVVVGGLGFGRQVLDWWRGDDVPLAEAGPLAALPMDWAEDVEPMHVALGDLPMRFVRQTIVGDQAEAVKALRAACRKSLASALPWSPRADEEEKKLLARLAAIEPIPGGSVGEAATADRLYEPTPGVPLIVGTRRLATGPPATVPQNRVVLWGLTAPAGEYRWTLHLFQADTRDADDDPRTQIPLPAACQRLMSLGRGEARMCAFQGAATCDECRQFYTRWHNEQQTHDAIEWKQTSGGGWFAHSMGRKSDTGSPAARSLMILLQPGRFGGCSGVVFSVARGDVR